jgi:myo-inositol-1(or 4)-monophosphatase
MPVTDTETARTAARVAGEIVRTGFEEAFETSMKGSVDPVTDVDEKAENAIRGIIAEKSPDDMILGEEGGGSRWDSERIWIVDPLDGTVNFVHGVPQFAVSIALWEDGRPQLGVVLDVIRSEEFFAIRGEGATLNGRPISVSKTCELENSLLGTGFPYDRRTHGAAYLAVVGDVLASARGMRRLGSAALDMCWEHGGPHGVKPWDVAAGMLIVTEAGGEATDENGDHNRLDARAFIATNGLIHEPLRQIVEARMPEHLR